MSEYSESEKEISESEKELSEEEKEEVKEEVKPKKRGRPRKQKNEEVKEIVNEDLKIEPIIQKPKEKKARGRPRLKPVTVDDVEKEEVEEEEKTEKKEKPIDRKKEKEYKIDRLKKMYLLHPELIEEFQDVKIPNLNKMSMDELDIRLIKASSRLDGGKVSKLIVGAIGKTADFFLDTEGEIVDEMTQDKELIENVNTIITMDLVPFINNIYLKTSFLLGNHILSAVHNKKLENDYINGEITDEE